jgi:hypothetical protein
MMQTHGFHSWCALLGAACICLSPLACDDGDDDDVADDDVADDDAADDDSATGPTDDDDSAEGPLDEDGDGASFGSDCDDSDPWLNLDDADGDGASTCDGDCDDGDAALNIDDVDGDGTTTCENDCDDEDPDLSPDIAERCDGIDNDCDGEAEQDGDGACGHLWMLDADDDEWSRIDLLDADDEDSPVHPVEAAFTIAEVGRIWVFTNYTYHVMDVDTYQWTDSGDREDVLHNVTEEHAVFAARAVPSTWTGTEDATVVLYVTGNRHTYAYDLDTDDLTVVISEGYEGPWDSQLAPPHTHIRCAWMDMDNAPGWVTEGDPAADCNGLSDEIEAYFAVMSLDGHVHLYDFAHCADFFAAPWASDFSVFGYDEAPNPTDIEAATFTGETLLMFDT